MMHGGARSGAIDALRAIAMLAVVALHARLLPFGWIGVWLFFSISGYVVTLSVIERGPEAPLTRLGGFLRRRAARIVPVYYAFLIAGLIAGAAQGLRQDRLSIASLIFFFDNATMIVGRGTIAGWPSGHLWTLSVEMQFYALYGVALCLLPGRITRDLLIAIIAICPLARLGVSWWLASAAWSPLNAAYAIYAGPLLQFDTFAMGCLLAFAHQRRGVERVARPLLVGGALALAIYAVVYVGINRFAGGASGIAMLRGVLSGVLYGQFREVMLYSAVGVAMTGLVAAAVVRDAWVRPLLDRRALQRIGEISYGGYLFHVLALHAMKLVYDHAGVSTAASPALRLLTFVLATTVTLAMAGLSYHGFEVPLRRALTGSRVGAPEPRAAHEGTR